MDCPGRLLRAIIILVVTGELFHLLDVFQRFLLARFIRKNVTAVKFSPQRYLKGITKWYCHRVPYITCHEGIKDENNSKAVVHDVC